MLFNHTWSRWQAAQAHFLISVIIATAACALILFVWYPGALFSAIVGPLLLLLLVGIDVCLGPLMTLILFNPKKTRKQLTLDLSLIAVIQLAALSYGLHTAYVARPAFVVYDSHQFVAISANDMEQQWLDAAELSQYRHLPINGPQWVAIRPPKNNLESSDQSFYRAVGQMSDLGIATQAQYYVPLAQQQQQLIEASKPLDKLPTLEAKVAEHLQKVIVKRQLNQGDLAWLPLKARRATLAVLINKKSGNVVELLPLE